MEFSYWDCLQEIKYFNSGILCISLWNTSYLFVGYGYEDMKLIDIKAGKVIRSFDGQKSVLSIKKIIHPIYGEILITQSKNDQIKLWVNNFNY